MIWKIKALNMRGKCVQSLQSCLSRAIDKENGDLFRTVMRPIYCFGRLCKQRTRQCVLYLF
jgi:hypothetical protein